MDIYTIQRGIGHTVLVATCRYMHVTAGHLAKVKSPLDSFTARRGERQVEVADASALVIGGTCSLDHLENAEGSLFRALIGDACNPAANDIGKNIPLVSQLLTVTAIRIRHGVALRRSPVGGKRPALLPSVCMAWTGTVVTMNAVTARPMKTDSPRTRGWRRTTRRSCRHRCSGISRKDDLPALRKRMETPEGKAILASLKSTLGGGEAMPTEFSKSTSAYQNASPNLPIGSYTISTAAGFGFLYQLTGQKKYADLGREAFEWGLKGIRDRDDRYAFRKPGGALDARAVLSLENLVKGTMPPFSNHFGMMTGGAAISLLAVTGDKWVDQARIDDLLKTSEKSMARLLTEAWGDGGFFPEGDGTGSMSSHLAYLPALQVWRVAAGKDFVTPKVAVQWMALKWFFLTQPSGDHSNLNKDFPIRGYCGQNVWSHEGLSGGGYFGIGMGVLNNDQRAALLWCYNHWLRDLDTKNGKSCDTVSAYPHHAILSFVNWPVGTTEKDPGTVLPHAYRDTKWQFYAWRNRWQDGDDVIISILTKFAKGYMSSNAENTLTVWGGGKRQKWGTITGGFTGDYAPAANGSTILTTGDGSSLAIDFSGASGADAMLAMTGPGAPAVGAVDAGGTRFSFLFVTKGAPPVPKVEADKIAIGNQTVSFDGKRLVLAKQTCTGR